MKEEKLNKVCAYPDCVNYNKQAMIYCCAACADDHYDWLKVKANKKKNKGSLKIILDLKEKDNNPIFSKTLTIQFPTLGELT